MVGGCSGCVLEHERISPQPKGLGSGPCLAPPVARWVCGGGESSPATVPEGLAPAGCTAAGAPVYVGRATYGGHLLPATVMPSRGGAFIPWGGYVYFRLPHEYELLLVTRGKMVWVPASDGDLPAYAFPAGLTTDGEQVFVARAKYSGALAIGRVSVLDRTCYIPYLAEEVAVTEYEVLVVA